MKSSRRSPAGEKMQVQRLPSPQASPSARPGLAAVAARLITSLACHSWGWGGSSRLLARGAICDRDLARRWRLTGRLRDDRRERFHSFELPTVVSPSIDVVPAHADHYGCHSGAQGLLNS
jgi:hypothetical protein